ncbi:MAG: NAD(P)/FAD-dependent oxidoreductase [Candidatus Cloacimonetes bacterium]|nr:NAD(P)/FAD-dependent oxidoreductase [Candidatus Cloacimonadota bacterium]MCF7869369.1 NAD(P)/FAD-dependent oxidoreductase [Candidatus Cloacimonadota bacterium]
MQQEIAIIIGAGPAGLTAALELIRNTDVKPIILEATNSIGGISKTVNFKGNRIDIGGHRFFSKSDVVMNWWQQILPIAENEKQEEVLLKRNRLSRILFLRKFFNYPISLNIDTIKNLGFKRLFKITFDYLYIRIFPIKKEKNLEDFFINRFGNELYKTFFRDYTEKVWGISCDKIKPEWGAQRIKGLSITSAIKHSLKKMFSKDKSISQKKTETSLIEQFLYPKYGPGQLWEKVAEMITEKGGKIHLNEKVVNIENGKEVIEGVLAEKAGVLKEYKCDYLISTMPVKDLIYGMINHIPHEVREIAEKLVYRDFITVGLLLKKMKVKNKTRFKTRNDLIPDNWIYIQEPDVKLGRLQIFNNWSPYMVKDPDTVWVGLEYFCNEGDDLWSKTDEEFAEFAVQEFIKIGMIDEDDVIDKTVIRMPKTYPAYFGSYDQFDVIRNFTDAIPNLFLIGRNGMHRYNNQDHSMLTAMEAVKNIKEEITKKDNIWNVNAEQEYHEEK